MKKPNAHPEQSAREYFIVLPCHFRNLKAQKNSNRSIRSKPRGSVIVLKSPSSSKLSSSPIQNESVLSELTKHNTQLISNVMHLFFIFLRFHINKRGTSHSCRLSYCEDIYLFRINIRSVYNPDFYKSFIKKNRLRTKGELFYLSHSSFTHNYRVITKQK